MKKHNIKMVISYDGSRYLGWQRLGGKQKTQSIQGFIEDILEDIAGYSIAITGSGRTDAGVHALGQVANFHVPSSFFLSHTLEELQQQCNERLPEDIRICSVEEVPECFHSRYSATKKTYEYHVDTREVPVVFTRKYALWEPKALNLSAMRECSRLFVGKHDFKAFSTQRQAEKDTVRTIFDFFIEQREEELIFSVCGDGFLYNMVRILVGTLLEVGRGERTRQQVAEALHTGDRQLAGYTVSSVGLFLKEVVYKD